MSADTNVSADTRKRKREADALEETLLQKEIQRQQAKEQEFRNSLAERYKQSLTPEDKKRLMEAWRLEREKKRQQADEAYHDHCSSGHVERLFTGGPFALMIKIKENLDSYIDELEVLPSTDMDEERWQWSMIPGKGTLTLHHPSGKLVGDGGWVQEIWLQHWMKRWTEPWDDDTPKETQQPLSEEAEAYEQFNSLPGMRRLFGGSPLEFQDHLDHVKGDTRSTLQELPAKAPGVKYWLWRHPKLKGAVQLVTPSGEVKCQGNLLQQASFFMMLKNFTAPYVPGAAPPPPPPPPPPPTAAAFPPPPSIPPPPPPVGTYVRIRNLKNAKQYNGRLGVVTQVVTEADTIKLDIRLQDEEHTVRLKQINAEILPEEEIPPPATTPQSTKEAKPTPETVAAEVPATPGPSTTTPSTAVSTQLSTVQQVDAQAGTNAVATDAAGDTPMPQASADGGAAAVSITAVLPTVATDNADDDDDIVVTKVATNAGAVDVDGDDDLDALRAAGVITIDIDADDVSDQGAGTQPTTTTDTASVMVVTDSTQQTNSSSISNSSSSSNASGPVATTPAVDVPVREVAAEANQSTAQNDASPKPNVPSNECNTPQGMELGAVAEQPKEVVLITGSVAHSTEGTASHEAIAPDNTARSMDGPNPPSQDQIASSKSSSEGYGDPTKPGLNEGCSAPVDAMQGTTTHDAESNAPTSGIMDEAPAAHESNSANASAAPVPSLGTSNDSAPDTSNLSQEPSADETSKPTVASTEAAVDPVSG